MRGGKQKKGFTLLEILLVIAAIGILAAIVLIAINPNKQIEAAREAKRKSDQNAIAKAIQQYIIERGVYPPALQGVGVGSTVGLCVVAGCSNGIDLSSALSDYIAGIPIPDRGQYLVTKTVNGVSTGYDNSNILATAAGGTTVAPTLDLNFARDKQLTNAVNGTNPISFIRNVLETTPTATYVDSDGLIKTAAVNAPRFNHNPVTRESLGLLVEEQRTNLLLQSADLAASTSLNNVAIIANTIASPDGGINADIVTGSNSTSNVKVWAKTATTSTIGTYTFSVYLKANTQSVILIRIDDAAGGNGANQLLNLATGQLSGGVTVNGTATAANATITNVGNGWYRCSITATLNSVLTQSNGSVWFDTWGASTSTNSYYAWGAQLEQGAFATSYIPTTTATVQRFADSATIIAGTNFNSWYNQLGGTFYGETANVLGGGATITVRASTDAGERIQFSNAAAQTAVVSVSAVQAIFGSPGGNKVALGYAANDFALKRVGVALETDSSGVLPTVNMATVGHYDFGGQERINGSIKRITYWPTRLSNTVLQSITQ